LGIGGSNERARELLKRYYGRVKEANRNFTSYCEGWKTDRGMIFIIFGPPVNVYHSRRDEVWVYGNEANPGALRFIFNKLENRLKFFRLRRLHRKYITAIVFLVIGMALHPDELVFLRNI